MPMWGRRTALNLGSMQLRNITTPAGFNSLSKSESEGERQEKKRKKEKKKIDLRRGKKEIYTEHSGLDSIHLDSRTSPTEESTYFTYTSSKLSQRFHN
ncbi:hypothetical protein TWF569_002473 [Orbilia oligospora]|uniref:Uncharacterized protein n=1 Tax=Orbilia oligospora TaxID=2813651 RepID=A0A7C8JI43_ORBOL|nr:hypothetical protein TWF102_007949 [Orbilia oligospora]KAF3106344.1 hypothetical protein TWF103_006433 [Orbilia oligospora]KAF3110995.1 hypothetical protein TWF706_000444 [Orbilia oligospora]KAF3121841.1 hypothetical protein TWF569_002473 [Orbilia oligospora]KAF3144510.1 hypothetical protein TWF594_004671 [Orbilia oligospora]